VVTSLEAGSLANRMVSRRVGLYYYSSMSGDWLCKVHVDGGDITYLPLFVAYSIHGSPNMRSLEGMPTKYLTWGDISDATSRAKEHIGR
jgi:hypothetical protein